MSMSLTDLQKTYISAGTTTQVATGKCRLIAIIINTPAAGTIGIIDGTSGSTVNVGQIAASAVGPRFEYHCNMASGIRIVTAAATDITVIWDR